MERNKKNRQSLTLINPYNLAFLLSLLFFLISAQKVKELDFPPKSQSLETLHPSIVGFTRRDKELILIAKEQAFLIFAQYPRVYDTAKKVPSPFDGSVRKKLPFPNRQAWNGIIELSPGLLLFNGQELATALVSNDKLSLISQHTVTYDLIRPPRDRGGEAPAWELKQLRQRFLTKFKQTHQERFAGLTPLPKAWHPSKKSAYLLASRIPSFPLVVMACNPSNPSQCSLERACLVAGLAQLSASAIVGPALSPKRRIILLGDRKRHRLIALKFNSCLHVTYAYEIALPQKLKEINALMIDEDDKLWISTQRPDDYHNASVYHWPGAKW